MKRFVHFWLWLRKKTDRQKFGSTSEQKLLESLEKCAKLKEYKFTLQWVITAAFAEGTIRSLKNILHRNMDDYGYKYIHKLSQLVRTLTSRKKLPNRFDIKKCQDFRLSLQSVQQATTRIESPSRRLETEFASQAMTYPSGTVIRHTLLRKILKLLQFLPENLQHTQ